MATKDEDLQAAVNSSFTDIEDGFQYYPALGKCDAFITFNKKDFSPHQNKQLLCLTPSEFLKTLE